MTNADKVELELALNAVRLLAEHDAAIRITLEWRPGTVPKLTYVPSNPLEYISVSFTVQDEESNA